MIVFSHLQLSRIIRAQLRKERLSLNTRSFAYGNVKPDLSAMIRTQRHNVTDSYVYICRALAAMAASPFEGRKKAYSYHLGIICHYVTDFFTYPHNSTFHGNFKQHMNYEMAIHDHLIEFSGALRMEAVSLHSATQFATCEELIAYLDRMHALYMSDVHPNPQRDLTFAINVCTVLCRVLLELSSRHHRFAPVVGF